MHYIVTQALQNKHHSSEYIDQPASRVTLSLSIRRLRAKSITITESAHRPERRLFAINIALRKLQCFESLALLVSLKGLLQQSRSRLGDFIEAYTCQTRGLFLMQDITCFPFFSIKSPFVLVLPVGGYCWLIQLSTAYFGIVSLRPTSRTPIHIDMAPGNTQWNNTHFFLVNIHLIASEHFSLAEGHAILIEIICIKKPRWKMTWPDTWRQIVVESYWSLGTLGSCL